MLLTVLKYLGKALAWILLLAGTYVLLGVLLSLIPVGPRPGAQRGERPRTLRVSNNGVHTDLIFERDLLPAEFLAQFDWAADYRFLAFGWGDKGFYLDTPTWAELSPTVAVRAMLLPSPTAMHVTGYRTADERWAAVPVDDRQVGILLDHIRATFDADAAGNFRIIPGESYGADDHFYEAHGNYSAIVTCNVWVNRALKKAGIRTGLWAPSSWGIMRWL